MSKYSEILDLEVESLNNLGDVYFGYAGSLLRSEESKYNPYVASCYTLSGILKSIIKPGSGRESFRLAADYYRNDGNTYWLVCSICAYDIRSISSWYDDKSKISFESSMLEKLLTSLLIEENMFQESDLLNLSAASLGRLSIPAKVYLDALIDVSEETLNRHTSKRSFDNILSFLKRSTENIFLLKQDSFHWKNLYGNFVPLEPETLAFCIILCRRFKRLNLKMSDLFANTEINPIAKVPIQIADEICKREEYG